MIKFTFKTTSENKSLWTKVTNLAIHINGNLEPWYFHFPLSFILIILWSYFLIYSLAIFPFPLSYFLICFRPYFQIYSLASALPSIASSRSCQRHFADTMGSTVMLKPIMSRFEIVFSKELLTWPTFTCKNTEVGRLYLSEYATLVFVVVFIMKGFTW